MSPSGFPTWEESSHVGFLSAPLLQTPRGEFSAWRTAMATVDVVAATIRSSSSAVASLFPFPKLRRSRSFSSSCLPTCVEITNISHIWSTFTFNNMTTEQLTLTTSSIGKKNPLKILTYISSTTSNWPFLASHMIVVASSHQIVMFNLQ